MSYITTKLREAKTPAPNTAHSIAPHTYRTMMSKLIEIIKHEWDKVHAMHPKIQCDYVENHIKHNPLCFDVPPQLRRACIIKAVEVVTSYQINLYNAGQYAG